MPRRPSSSCRQFRRQHAEFVDGYLSDEARRTCLAHLDECRACTCHDVRIRRSLLALQALPKIEPSAGFHDRLSARLSREALHYSPVPSRRVRWGVATTFVAASVALLLVASFRSRQTDAGPLASAEAHAPVRLAPERPAPAPAAGAAVTGAAVAGVSGVTQVNASPSRARFEALPRALPREDAARFGPLLPQGAAVRLQAVSYLGQ